MSTNKEIIEKHIAKLGEKELLMLLCVAREESPNCNSTIADDVGEAVINKFEASFAIKILPCLEDKRKILLAIQTKTLINNELKALIECQTENNK